MSEPKTAVIAPIAEFPRHSSSTDAPTQQQQCIENSKFIVADSVIPPVSYVDPNDLVVQFAASENISTTIIPEDETDDHHHTESKPSISFVGLDCLKGEGGVFGLGTCRCSSLADKFHIIDLAIDSADPDLIAACFMFLRLTLKPMLLRDFITSHPDHRVRQHFVHFLKAFKYYGELSSLRKAIIKPSECCNLVKTTFEDLQAHYPAHSTDQSNQSTASRSSSRPLLRYFAIEEGLAMLKYAYSVRDFEARLLALQRCSEFFKRREVVEIIGEEESLFYSLSASNNISLLRRQASIERTDDQRYSSGLDPIFVKYPRKSVLGESVHRTLHYCQFYHFRASGKNRPWDPDSIIKEFNVPKIAALWTLLAARSAIGDWESVRGMVSKKILSRKVKSPFESFAPFVRAVASNDGPMELIEFFLDLIEDPSERFSLALEYSVFECAVSSCVELRDYQLLLRVRARGQEVLGYDSDRAMTLRGRIDEALKAPKQKWKNKPPS